MSIHAAIHHQTIYRYDRRVGLSPQIVRLKPAPHTRTRILGYSLTVEPAGHFINWQQDPFSNWQARVVFPEPVTEFRVTVDLTADLAVINPFDFFVEPAAEHFPFEYAPETREDLQPYLRRTEPGPLLKAFLKELPRSAPNTVDFLVALNGAVMRRVAYLIRLEPGVQTPEETLQKACGSCRDSAWLMVQVLRHLGLAARFVSGYLIQLVADEKSLDGPSGPPADFTDLHAWAEVFIPGAGWLGLDPTSGLFAGEGHIPLCATPEPQGAAPISGAVDECEVSFEHHMQVARIAESPRVTRPYTDAQWAAIDALGAAVDVRLEAGDVRLTMGGEPTFVSLDDREEAEWNTDAIGPHKEKLSYTLLQRLRARHAPNGLMTFGQGKWYPGEPLPRWAYTLYWRRDAEPIWRLPPPQPRSPAPTLDDARKLMAGIVKRLDLNPRHVLEAYEDTMHHLVRERRLPINLDPADPRLDSADERARLLAVFERGLGTPRGLVLPVQRWNADGRWMSDRWAFRSGKLFLTPGDSPIGLRLPLDSLPLLPADEYPQVQPVDPSTLTTTFQPRTPTRRVTGDAAGVATKAATPVRTALAVEARDGYVNVFLPPVPSAEDFLELVAVVEAEAAQLGAPVRLEGYPPPYDLRLDSIKITPDPGVIEVNVKPARSWAELRDDTTALYEEARQARLTTEKFLIDGRAVGTGGGNHVVVGGATPADSPFLRRPHLIASLIRYWQNHPSLSYVFSGLFIGPTSQHPRVDEARDSALYELETALAQLPAGDGAVPPWLVDRVLRHLLTDLTGNTHRAEFCIDKLFSPDSSTGRLGLLELRGFEMPPHARMSLAQQLLVRALIASFWDRPYTRPLLRWGTQVHDRWMLPHYNWRDLSEVCADLQANGIDFRAEWLAPHHEFRFPQHGTLDHDGLEIELRHALEPWPVLGEEPGAGGTARFVDSSVERLQVLVSGLAGDRYAVACNGRRVPLRPTAGGERVAGVRYRAWQPASALHPTIGVHTPLVFDLYDTWSGRAVTGCTYHVAHPAGRNYDTYPVNANEAEARRLARFERSGHTAGPYELDPAPPSAEYPMTLDLRRT